MPRVIALTGATGFIGGALLKRLASDGNHVRALYRQSSASARTAGANIRWVPGQLDDPESLKRLLKGTDTVVHCAGAVRGAEWRQFKRVNTEGVARMVRAAKRMHPSPRFLLLSSLAAREPQLSHHAASKRQGEEMLASQGNQLQWSALRPPAVYGPGDREIAPLFRLMCKGMAPQTSSRTSRFSMLYVDDLVQAIVTLIEHKRWPGAIFELHDGRPGGYAWGDVVQMVAKVAGRPIRSLRLPSLAVFAAAAVNLLGARTFGYAPMLTPGKVRELTHPDWTCDNTSIAAQIGWQPSVNLEQGIKKTLVFMGFITDNPNRQTTGTPHADI
ncbi:MAG: NAD-dependent epimerase/dehydratase family protein [Desulfobacterales bacterium]|nr:NAD-dependent epimerase/dehydratase family protein [Desulfobacterales bacterium]